MKRYLLFLSFVVPLFCFSAVDCVIEQNSGVDGNIYIRCYETDHDLEPEGPILSQEKCEQLKQSTINALDSTRSSLVFLKDQMDTTLGSKITSIQNSNDALYQQIITLNPDTSPIYSRCMAEIGNINVNLAQLAQFRTQALDDIDGSMSLLDVQISNINGYVCSDSTCSGSGNDGTVKCPCSAEFQRAVNALNESNRLVSLINDAVVSNSYQLILISSSLGVISDSFTSITNRLNSPDDRMWGELQDLYSGLSSRLSTVATNALNLTNIFYHVRQLLRGDTGTRLELSTEGVISLYDSLFGMVNTLQNSYSANSFNNAVVYFSNTVSSLFVTYNSLISSSALDVVPLDTRYTYLFSAFTNDASGPRNRYARLLNRNAASVTNWFQRMELYQQANLGWFDTFSTGTYSAEQNRTTESALEQSFLETTNSLSTITEASSNLVISVNDSVTSMIEELKTVQISASLPTQIRLFPEVEIGSGIAFGPIDFDTTPIQDICDLARRITSLVWRVSFWLVYVLLAVGVARVVFVLILFVINLSKSL